MPWPELEEMDAVDLAALVRDGRLSAVQVVEAFLARIDKVDPQLRAFVCLDAEAALARAARVADEPLAGVPFAVKDIAAYPGMRWAMGSRLMAANRAEAHSAYTQALDDAGLVTLGKTATSELGLLGSTETLLEGVTANPWQAGLSAAGSSGGAAAAVAAGLLPVAHASDGGGSIRVPASVCGLFGFKPSNGRIRSTLPNAGGLGRLLVDHVVSRSVRDSAALLAATERTDAGAPFAPLGTVAPMPPGRLRVATWDTTLLGHRPEPEVAEALAEAHGLLMGLGHVVEPVDPPPIDGVAVSEAFFTLAGLTVAQVAALLAPVLGRDVGPGELEPFTSELLEWYRGLPPTAVPQAETAMVAAAERYRAVFTDHDVVLTPTLATLPWPVGHLSPELDRAELIARTERAVGYTPIDNMAGTPSMSVPLASSRDGLPIGLQLSSAPGRDRLLLQLAYQLERARPWRDRRPPLSAWGG